MPRTFVKGAGRNITRAAAVTTLLIATLIVAEGAAALTIYDVQYSTPPDYESSYLGQTVTVTGGIVTKVLVGYRTKLTIQDPTLGNAWAGVQVVFTDSEEAEGIVRGDRVDFYDVLVDEYRGNTQLLFEEGSSLDVVSSGNYVTPLVVSTADIPFPADHDRSEEYEFMLLTVNCVQVGEMGLGKADDDYELVNVEGTCWASDYANYDLPPGEAYFVSPGETFLSITGYLEQYLNPPDGWDYYQLLPRDAGDYVSGASATEAETWSGVKVLFK